MACEYSFETNPFCHLYDIYHKRQENMAEFNLLQNLLTNVHKNLSAPQSLDLLEKLALFFLYNFYREHGSLKLQIKKLSPKRNVKNIKNHSFFRHYNILLHFRPPTLTLVQMEMLHILCLEAITSK